MSKSVRRLIFITGGAGFIGCNLARSLTDSGHRVVISDWLGSDQKWRNLAGVPIDDLVYPEKTLEWLSRHAPEIDAILHMGAVSATTERDGDKVVHNNIRLTLDLWSLCSSNNIRFIYASSAATYGDGTYGFNDSEELGEIKRLRPLNAYGWSKWVIDRRLTTDVAEGFARPPQWAGLRFFNVYGPYEDHKGEMRSVVNKIYPIVTSDQPVSLFKSYRHACEDGQQKRDFIYVDDCVAVVRWLLEDPRVSGIFNVGTGEARSFGDLALAVFSSVGKPPQIEFVEMPEELRDKYQYFTQAKTNKLREAGFSARFASIEAGVAKYVQTYLAVCGRG